jgi:ectoine hydroxylase-related dioxygenase (phytanoyl-CoA dioxygenase family)
MLTGPQIKSYKSKGFCVRHDFLSQSEVDHLLSEMEEVSAGSTLANHDATRIEMEPKQSADGTKLRRIYEPCTYYDSFRKFAESKTMVDSMVQLLGRDVLYFSSKINVKPGEIGSVVEWHQDMAYGPLTNRSVVAILIYLDDADLENGCLQVVPGHHRMLDHSHDGYFQGRITEALDTSKAISLEGKRGTAVFFNGLAPHASAPNTSPRPRRTLILGYRAADAFPIHVGEMSVNSDQFVRLVHGEFSRVARFDMDQVFIPRYAQGARSLYELQERSRKDLPAKSIAVVDRSASGKNLRRAKSR